MLLLIELFTKLKNTDIQTTENEASRNIQAIYRHLDQVGPLPFWKFVLHPKSFSQTVENAFHVAFLAKEGRIRIDEPDSEEDSGPWDMIISLFSLNSMSLLISNL